MKEFSSRALFQELLWEKIFEKIFSHTLFRNFQQGVFDRFFRHHPGGKIGVFVLWKTWARDRLAELVQSEVAER